MDFKNSIKRILKNNALYEYKKISRMSNDNNKGMDLSEKVSAF